MTKPLITIGLTAFNAAGSIERAVTSALEQTWRPIELVVVEDCSTDDTDKVLANMAARHPEIRLFCNQTNGGVAVSRNRILDEARGEFVAFFDDDDWSEPKRIQAQLNRILQYERDFADGAPVICHTARRLRYPDGRERVESTMGQRLGHASPAGLAVARRILLGTPLADGYGACPTCCQMARLSVYRALRGFNVRFSRCEDTDLNIRLAKAGGHFVGISQPLVEQTMTRSPEKTLLEEYRNVLLLLETHRDIMDKENQYGFCRRWIDAKQAWLEGQRGEFALSLISLSLVHPILTARRLAYALPNLGFNRATKYFHAEH